MCERKGIELSDGTDEFQVGKRGLERSCVSGGGLFLLFILDSFFLKLRAFAPLSSLLMSLLQFQLHKSHFYLAINFISTLARPRLVVLDLSLPIGSSLSSSFGDPKLNAND